MTKEKDGQASVESYFGENAESWILDAYEYVGHNYPVGVQRVRLVQQILPGLTGVRRVIDVGCGGGHLSCALAQQGYGVLGIDQSEPMIAHARRNAEALDPAAADRVRFELGSLGDAQSETFDTLTAMGVVGYLPSDETLFEAAKPLLRSQGYVVVSFRNRLFNLFSVSQRTVAEADAGTLRDLVEEASALHATLDRESLKAFVKRLHAVTGSLLEDGSLDQAITADASAASPSAAKGHQSHSTIEARQTTPTQARERADSSGYNTVAFYGVHPHLTVPALNTRLPFQVFNRLSDAMIPLEATPAALLWSSVFIGVFQLRS
jgi:2-polyprenyl-3-methyl-5-hydroxy-6-metoxy-1,4-benzoquinol methylase